MRPVGRIYLERGEPVVVRVQWGLKSRGESYGGPRNVLIERESGELVVRPFRGLRPAYTTSRGNQIPCFASLASLDAEALALLDELRSRPCGSCGEKLAAGVPWWDAPDPCIADLPGVAAACCGHGHADETGDNGVSLDGLRWDTCYVLFEDGLRLGGNAARAAMRMLGGDPPDAPEGATVRVGWWRGVDTGWGAVAEFPAGCALDSEASAEYATVVVMGDGDQAAAKGRDEALAEVCSRSVVLLEALRPWASCGPKINTACVELTLALAMVPETAESSIGVKEGTSVNDVPENVQRVFELYVDQLIGEAETLDEVLLDRVRWLAEDARTVADRLQSEPHAAVALVAGLSRAMQEIDHAAGASDHAHEAVKYARRWALLLPASAVHDEPSSET